MSQNILWIYFEFGVGWGNLRMSHTLHED